MEEFKVEQVLRVLKKSVLRIWKSYLEQDFAS